MTTDIKDLQDTFQISSAVYKDSILEAREHIDLYHNRHFLAEELAILSDRGQPAETFNVFKMLTHAMLGYLETVANDIMIAPTHPNHSLPALLLNDTVQNTLKTNDFDTIGNNLKKDLILTGLSVCYENVVPTGATDQFGRNIYRIELAHVPSWQVRIDPMSRLSDYSDARFIHRWLWIDRAEFEARWPDKIKELDGANDNHLNETDAEFTREFNVDFQGKYSYWDNYLIVHSIVKDTTQNKYFSVIWSGDIELEKSEVTYKKVKNPYRVNKLFDSDKAEFYGMFREAAESQKAINQAIIQIQMLVNTSKAIVETTSLKDNDADAFRDALNRVNAVIEVKSLKGILIEDMSRDVLDQYNIIDKALERIKLVMGINDSFLGNAMASDSGRKVQIQKQSSSSQLTPLVNAVQQMHTMLGTDIVALQQQYYGANQILRIADKVNGDRFLELNRPLTVPTGELDERGQPIEVPVFDEELDPETGEPLEDANGNIIITPLNNPLTDLKYAEVDVEAISVPYNNAEERNQLLFETFLQGPAGQYIGQMDPSSYLAVLSLQIEEFGAKHSPQIAQIIQNLVSKINNGQVDPSLAMTGGNTQAVLGAAMGGDAGNHQNPKSQTLQIPTKYNEGGQ
jgi:hypothetical protein